MRKHILLLFTGIMTRDRYLKIISLVQKNDNLRVSLDTEKSLSPGLLTISGNSPTAKVSMCITVCAHETERSVYHS